MKKKCSLSVRQAVKLAYDEEQKVFHTVTFLIKVRLLLGRPACMDGTILRRLRELRADGVINYRVKNNELSIYEKIDL